MNTPHITSKNAPAELKGKLPVLWNNSTKSARAAFADAATIEAAHQDNRHTGREGWGEEDILGKPNKGENQAINGHCGKRVGWGCELLTHYSCCRVLLYFSASAITSPPASPMLLLPRLPSHQSASKCVCVCACVCDGTTSKTCALNNAHAHAHSNKSTTEPVSQQDALLHRRGQYSTHPNSRSVLLLFSAFTNAPAPPAPMLFRPMLFDTSDSPKVTHRDRQTVGTGESTSMVWGGVGAITHTHTTHTHCGSQPGGGGCTYRNSCSVRLLCSASAIAAAPPSPMLLLIRLSQQLQSQR